MAKARAIVKRRKAVRNIKKITKTMQMIATAKFQKSLRRATGTKPYTQKVRELVQELAASIGDIEHPLLRRPTDADRKRRIALIVLTSNRGLAGAYNGSVLRAANAFLKQQAADGISVDLYVGGKKGASYFNFQKRPISQRLDLGDAPKFEDVEKVANEVMDKFIKGEIDAVYVAYMNFVSASNQKPEVLNLLPLAGVKAEGKSAATQVQTVYEFSPSAKELLDELLPQTVKSALFQAFLDATTSEHVARMVAMKSATDNADKMVKSLTMQYNRARQSQITTELSEIMGGVEAMKA
ncbi:MAG TPA: ATP synthase F1 subunit gamma [Tepidisphaeraceae bacterium]|jgi:F-type H+-transporting ATPase subunit gamma